MKAILTSVLFISLLISIGRSPSAVGAGAQGSRPPAPARASTTQQPADGGWPRAYVTPSGARLVIDEPQIGRWLDQKRAAMYAAVPWTGYGAQHAGTAAAAPTVLVSQSPAELMLLNGAAAYTPVMGTCLERVSNAGSNVFRLGTTGTVYSRVSEGRLSAQYPTRFHGARYSPWTGPYTPVGVVYGPCGGAGYAARYNPRTETCARSAAAWGPCGPGGAAQAWNPRTGPDALTRQGPIVREPGFDAAQLGDQWARTARVTNRATGAATRVTVTSGGDGAVRLSAA